MSTANTRIQIRRWREVTTSRRTGSCRPISPTPGMASCSLRAMASADVTTRREDVRTLRRHGNCHASNVLWPDDADIFQAAAA